MYQNFDTYLNTATWHTGHDTDNERFLIALSQVVKDPAFNPDKMGEYMRAKHRVDRDNPDQVAFNRVIDQRVTEAWAIRDYLALVG